MAHTLLQKRRFLTSLGLGQLAEEMPTLVGQPPSHFASKHDKTSPTMLTCRLRAPTLFPTPSCQQGSTIEVCALWVWHPIPPERRHHRSVDANCTPWNNGRPSATTSSRRLSVASGATMSKSLRNALTVTRPPVLQQTPRRSPDGPTLPLWRTLHGGGQGCQGDGYTGRYAEWSRSKSTRNTCGSRRVCGDVGQQEYGSPARGPPCDLRSARAAGERRGHTAVFMKKLFASWVASRCQPRCRTNFFEIRETLRAQPIGQCIRRMETHALQSISGSKCTAQNALGCHSSTPSTWSLPFQGVANAPCNLTKTRLAGFCVHSSNPARPSPTACLRCPICLRRLWCARAVRNTS